jgi:hypothetical protein
MAAHTASCSCGQLVVETKTDPVRVTMCHCLACQRRTGSVFSAQARFNVADVEIRGESKQYVRVGDEGSKITFHFCPACGATVHYGMDVAPDLVAVPVGAFADPSFPAPVRSVYESRKHAWVTVPRDIEHHE